MTISCNTFYGGARVVILYTLSSAKCSNTAYGAKPSRTSNNNNKVMNKFTEESLTNFFNERNIKKI